MIDSAARRSTALGWNGDGAASRRRRRPADVRRRRRGRRVLGRLVRDPGRAPRTRTPRHAGSTSSTSPRSTRSRRRTRTTGRRSSASAAAGCSGEASILGTPDVFPSPSVVKKLEPNSISPKGTSAARAASGRSSRARRGCRPLPGCEEGPPSLGRRRPSLSRLARPAGARLVRACSSSCRSGSSAVYSFRAHGRLRRHRLRLERLENFTLPLGPAVRPHLLANVPARCDHTLGTLLVGIPARLLASPATRSARRSCCCS